MASTINKVKVYKTSVQVVDRHWAGQRDSAQFADRRFTSDSDALSFLQYHPSFADLVGHDVQYALLISSAETSQNAFFHSGCTHVVEPCSSSRPGSNVGDRDDRGRTPSEEEVLYTTSNLLMTTSSAQLPVILISRVVLRRTATGAIASVDWAKLRPPANMPMPAGALSSTSMVPGAATNGRNSTGILYCAQGNSSSGSSGLYFMPRGRPPQPIVNSYYGRDFNSVYDVVCAPDGALWFTDPSLGFAQDFRKRPQLPCHVYRFHAASSDLRVVIDSLKQPTGLCFSPDGTTLYVTDTDALHGDGHQDATRAATIYAFDVVQRAGTDFVANQRVFSYALRGTPMGIKCDNAGNVYAGCADGVEMWSAGGTLLGVIQVPDGVTSFCFARDDEMFLCAEKRLWWVRFRQETQE